jgi:hypothetical protein
MLDFRGVIEKSSSHPDATSYTIVAERGRIAEPREIQPKPTSGYILIGGYFFQSIHNLPYWLSFGKVVLEPRTNFTLLGFGAPISLPIQGLPNHAL